MMNKQTILRAILSINARFIGCAFLFFYGWGCWQIASPQNWGFGLIAILACGGAATSFVATVWQAIALILREGKLRAFARQGTAPKADGLARQEDLKKRGLLR